MRHGEGLFSEGQGRLENSYPLRSSRVLRPLGFCRRLIANLHRQCTAGALRSTYHGVLWPSFKKEEEGGVVRSEAENRGVDLRELNKREEKREADAIALRMISVVKVDNNRVGRVDMHITTQDVIHCNSKLLFDSSQYIKFACPVNRLTTFFSHMDANLNQRKALQIE
nr:hypothetical protein Iba_chr10bCG9240 [Ipomoea batatas]